MRRKYWLLFLALLLSAGCSAENWTPEELSLGKTTAERAQLRKGRDSYRVYCVGCHGANGDGNGPAARFLDPKPRDFKKGRVKFAAVMPGSLPRDEDLQRTLMHGLSGTSMPAWDLVPADEQRAIIAYIRTFSDVYTKRGAGAAIAIPADPWRKTVELGIKEGERVYHGFASCSSCHPAYVSAARIREHLASFQLPTDGVRADLYQSQSKESEWGGPILPPDFLFDRIKTGARAEDLIRVIASGVHGTAMPSWASSLSKEQLWGLAHYVASIAEKRGSPAAGALRKQLLATHAASLTAQPAVPRSDTP